MLGGHGLGLLGLRLHGCLRSAAPSAASPSTASGATTSGGAGAVASSAASCEAAQCGSLASNAWRTASFIQLLASRPCASTASSDAPCAASSSAASGELHTWSGVAPLPSGSAAWKPADSIARSSLTSPRAAAQCAPVSPPSSCTVAGSAIPFSSSAAARSRRPACSASCSGGGAGLSGT
eukprot:scaffold57511_cov68-Phaeocystis_antarctica.AAC.3